MAGTFTNRRAKIVAPEPVEPPPPMVVLELTLEEALVVKEACYYYWSRWDIGFSSGYDAYWHSPLSDEHTAATVAQDIYDEYMSGVDRHATGE